MVNYASLGIGLIISAFVAVPIIVFGLGAIVRIPIEPLASFGALLFVALLFGGIGCLIYSLIE